MAEYRERQGKRRVVKAIQIVNEPALAVQEIIFFFAPVFKHVQILDHPPRIRMEHDKRSFTAPLGTWVVNPCKGAYFPMSDKEFHERYELAGD